jgi:hypothetical protein
LDTGFPDFSSCCSKPSQYLYNHVHQRRHTRTVALAPNAWPVTMRMWSCLETVN